MSALTIGGISFGFIFGGLLIGQWLRRLLPQHHLSAESRDVVKLGMGLTASTAALVLGLLVASAKSSFDAQKDEITQISTNVVLLDRLLAQYGPETRAVRDALRNTVAVFIHRVWNDGGAAPELDPSAMGSETVYAQLHELSPANDKQRGIKGEALGLAVSLGKVRWLLFQQRENSVPRVFLILLIFWLTVLFASFSVFSQLNVTAIVMLLICALSSSSTIYLILEMGRPFEGMIRISGEPLRIALAHLG